MNIVQYPLQENPSLVLIKSRMANDSIVESLAIFVLIFSYVPGSH
ncbi:hypothetical protein NSQ54_15300 [Alkalihalobacillus sp. FSL W8-0930]